MPTNNKDFLAEQKAQERGVSDDIGIGYVSDRLAKRYFDPKKDVYGRGARTLDRQDVRNASNLLGLDEDYGMNRNVLPSVMGDIDRGLDHIAFSKHQESPLNSSLLDPLYAASDLLRDGVKAVAAPVADAVDGADAWLFDKTGGLLGTPERISPRGQLNLRKDYRDQKVRNNGG